MVIGLPPPHEKSNNEGEEFTMRTVVASPWFSLALAMLIAAAGFFEHPYVVQGRDHVFDLYQRAFPRAPKSRPVIVVAIDEYSIAALGQWPWLRTRLAELLDRIGEGKPAAIGMDLFFPELDRMSPKRLAEVPGLPSVARDALATLPDPDEALGRALARNRVVLGVSGELQPGRRFPALRQGDVRLEIDAGQFTAYRGYIGSIEAVQKGAAGIALLNAPVTTSGIARSVQSVATVDGVPLLDLGAETLRVGLDTKASVVATGDGLYRLVIGRYSSPVQPNGETLLRFARADLSNYVSAKDVLSGKIAPRHFKDRIVLIGVTGLGILDFKLTPLNEYLPGVHVHAERIEQMFDGDSLQRPAWARYLESALL